MVNDVLLSSVMSAAAVLLAVYLTNRWNQGRWREERKERFYSHFMAARLDALMRINAAMVACYFQLNYYGNLTPQNRQIYEEKVGQKVQVFEDTFHGSSLWCTEDLTDILRKVQGSFRQASMAIFLHLPQEEIPNVVVDSYPRELRNLDWDRFTRSYSSARKALRSEGGIETLEEYIRQVRATPSTTLKDSQAM